MPQKKLGFGFMRLPVTNQEDPTTLKDVAEVFEAPLNF